MMNTIPERSPVGRLTVEIGRGYSLKPSSAGSHWRHFVVAFATYADSFQAGQDQSQAWPVTIGSAALNASVLDAMRRVK